MTKSLITNTYAQKKSSLKYQLYPPNPILTSFNSLSLSFLLFLHSQCPAPNPVGSCSSHPFPPTFKGKTVIILKPQPPLPLHCPLLSLSHIKFPSQPTITPQSLQSLSLSKMDERTKKDTVFIGGGSGSCLGLKPPEVPPDPMEFLSRSWSVSALEVSKALAPPPLLADVAPAILEESDEDHAAVATGTNFSFASSATSQLVLERIMSQSEISPLTSGRLSHSSGPLNGGGSLSDSPPVSPSDLEDVKVAPLAQNFDECLMLLIRAH